MSAELRGRRRSDSVAVAVAVSVPASAPGRCSRRSLRERLCIDEPTLQAALSALSRAGQVRQRRGRYLATPVGDVNTSADAARARALKAHWTRTALGRLENGAPGLFGYAVFAVARAHLRELRRVQLEYVQQINAIIAASSGEECVGLFCTQLLDLGQDDNALAD